MLLLRLLLCECVSETDTTLTEMTKCLCRRIEHIAIGDDVVYACHSPTHVILIHKPNTANGNKSRNGQRIFNFLVYWTHIDVLTIRLTFISFFIDYCGYQV